MFVKLADDLMPRLKKRLDETKVSKTTFANELGMSRGSLWYYLEGKRAPSFSYEQLQKIATFLNCSVRDLASGGNIDSLDVMRFVVYQLFLPTMEYVEAEEPSMIIDPCVLDIKQYKDYKAILSYINYGSITVDDRLLLCTAKDQKLVTDKLYYLVLEDQACIRKIRVDPFLNTVSLYGSEGKIEYTLSAKEWKEKVKFYYQIIVSEHIYK